MELIRRRMLRTLRDKVVTLVLAITILAVSPFVTGCSQNELASLVGVVGTSVSTLATVQGNTQLSGQLQTDFTAAQTAIAEWKKGSATDYVVQALSVLQKDLNLIPVSDQTKVYISLAIGTIQSILALVSPSSTSTGVTVSKPVSAGQYKKQWNALLAAHPTAEVKAIQ